MKKALVLSLALAIGLGFAVMAQTWEGTWDTDIVIVPAAATFANFISSFDSDLDVNFLVAGWDFGVTADFSAVGLDGFGFTAEGSLGAFSFSADVDFAPMKVSAVNTKYVGLAAADTNCTTQTPSIVFDSVVVTKTIAPAFDSLTLTGDVSIAGVSFAGVFMLVGTDMDAATTYSTYNSALFPVQFGITAGTVVGDMVYEANAHTVASSAKVGSGAKWTISGSIGSATISSYTYFNLSETMYNEEIYGTPSLEDALTKSGELSIVCEGCNVIWSSEYILIEGLSVGFCSVIDVAVEFTCCGFGGVDILFKDIELGFGIDLDFLVNFTTSAKTMTLTPEITLSGVCFVVVTELDYSDQTITGIQIEGLSASQTYNGLTVSFAATWDQTDNPLVGTAGTSTAGTIKHTWGEKVYFWIPDERSGDMTATDKPAIESDGEGDYVLSSADCYYETATVINKLSLDYEADACCGGLFSLSADTYFGTIATSTLSGIFASYYFDVTDDGASVWDHVYDFLGDDYGFDKGDGYSALTKIKGAYKAATDSDDDCLPCPVDAGIVAAQDVKIDKDYSTSVETSLFGWVESDIDLSVGVATNVTLDFGVDIAWWGWENISFGFTFEW